MFLWYIPIHFLFLFKYVTSFFLVLLMETSSKAHYQSRRRPPSKFGHRSLFEYYFKFNSYFFIWKCIFSFAQLKHYNFLIITSMNDRTWSKYKTYTQFDSSSKRNLQYGLTILVLVESIFFEPGFCKSIYFLFLLYFLLHFIFHLLFFIVVVKYLMFQSGN